jgi:hypothetical protein
MTGRPTPVSVGPIRGTAADAAAADELRAVRTPAATNRTARWMSGPTTRHKPSRRTRDSREPRPDQSSAGLSFVRPVLLALELERAVLDVEVPGQASAELVQHPAAVPVGQ